ncbi:MAG: AIPR family protein [Minisyncoccales bacterium]
MENIFLIQKNFVNIVIDKLSKFLSIDKDASFTRLSLGLILDLDENNIDDEIIIDGQGDKQLDAILIHEDDNTIDLVQTKKEKGFKSTKIIQIGNGLDWIFEKPLSDIKKLENVKFKNKINEIRDNAWNANLSVNVYYCTLGDTEVISSETEEEINTIKRKYNKFFKNKFSFKLIGSKELYELIQQRDKNDKVVEEKIHYEFHQDMANMLDYYIQDFKGAICTVKGSEIARLVKIHGDNLFEANIRKFLGTNKVNKAIAETCKSKNNSQFFWFFNNGITIVCEDFDVVKNPKNPHIEVHNAQIVNGCQTATTLFNTWKEGKLENKVKVLIKIFSAKDTTFVNKITEATNSQTSINARDLKANDFLQILIEGYLKEKYGYYYERKRNQYKGIRISRDKIINNEKVAQSFVAIGMKRPSTAKSSKAHLFADEFYEKIFSSPVEKLLISYKIVEFTEKEKKARTKNELEYTVRVYGFLHIARMMAYYLFKSEEFPDSECIDKCITIIKSKKSPLKKLYKKSLEQLIK